MAGPVGAEPSTETTVRVQALEAEISIARTSPDAYYLVIDLLDRRVYLKAGGRELLSAPITSSECLRCVPSVRGTTLESAS